MKDILLILIVAALAAQLLRTQRVAALGWSAVLGALLAAGFAFADPRATGLTVFVLASGSVLHVVAVEQAEAGTRERRLAATRRHARAVGIWIAQAIITGLVALLFAALTGRSL